jgi:hypothetical protein
VLTIGVCCIEVQTENDLIGPGAAVGTIATDLEQSTGLERLEILGKMEGVDIFDMKPLDSSRKGTPSTTSFYLLNRKYNPASLAIYNHLRRRNCTAEQEANIE